MKNICMVKESGMFLRDVNVGESLDIASSFYPNWDKKFTDRLLQEFELDKKKTYKNLSLGMKSQLGIIVGLASRAPLTIFDEPYIGLDAAGRQLFYDALIEDYMENPRTIILSTHLIDEVSNLLEEVIVLYKGSMMFLFGIGAAIMLLMFIPEVRMAAYEAIEFIVLRIADGASLFTLVLISAAFSLACYIIMYPITRFSQVKR